MEKILEKSLQMIKMANVKTEEEYNKFAKVFDLLSSESLKYITQEKEFDKIIKISKEVK